MHRRVFLHSSLASIGSLALACTPRAGAPGAPTEPNVEGPYYRAGAPLAAALDEHASLELHGTVLDTRCRPLAGAVIDVWHADGGGEYDLGGYRHRGIVRTDERGLYRLATIRPGNYRTSSVVRPAHIHVKVRATGRPELTTQLYFANDPHNDADPWFRPSLVIRERPDGRVPRPAQAFFDFVV